MCQAKPYTYLFSHSCFCCFFCLPLCSSGQPVKYADVRQPHVGFEVREREEKEPRARRCGCGEPRAHVVVAGELAATQVSEKL